MARTLFVLLTLLSLSPASSRAGGETDAAALGHPTPALARARWHGRLDGRHFSAVVRLQVARQARVELRRIDVWRDDVEGRRERLLARFVEPADLRGLGLLYLENPRGTNDYFVYQPALRRVRRMPESVVREDVYGVDLEVLGFGVAPLEATETIALDAVPLGGRATFRLHERALHANPRFDERLLWLDPESWLPLRTEHWRHGQLVLTARTEEVRDVQGVPTPARIVFERPGETVTMSVERVDYETPIPESFFSTLALVK